MEMTHLTHGFNTRLYCRCSFGQPNFKRIYIYILGLLLFYICKVTIFSWAPPKGQKAQAKREGKKESRKKGSYFDIIKRI